MIELAAAAGWALAALALGLWFGERGRRIDAQVRATGRLPDPVRRRRATVDKTEIDGEEVSEVAMDQAKERYVADAVNQGFDPEEAAADWDNLLQQVSTDQAGGQWDPMV